MVDNADAEIEALNTIDPLRTAVVDKRFQEDFGRICAAERFNRNDRVGRIPSEPSDL